MILYPLVVLDIEASGLGPRTYPIELGVALRYEKDSALFTWSSLIRPNDIWLTQYEWQDQAQDIHGINLADLTTAPDIHEVIDAFEVFVAGCGRIYSDNPYHDQRWLDHLYAQDPDGRISRQVTWPAGYDRITSIRERGPSKHRAGDDSLKILLQLEQARKS